MSKTSKLKTNLDHLAYSNETLDFSKPNILTEDMKAYYNYYGFDHTGIDHHFGKVQLDQTSINVQIFKPKSSRATIFLLHGYLSHTGHLRHVIHYLNKERYTVITYDLQGHGLSNGKAATITTFHDYVEIMEALLKLIQTKMLAPFYLIGHSTGGAIIIDYLLRHKTSQFKKVVLVAPLIRSSHWYLSKIGLQMTKWLPFITEIDRNFRKNSSDQSYLRALKQDPLQADKIPLQWINALMTWNGNIKAYVPTNKAIAIIQGNKDKTVDWKYNLAFIQSKFNNIQIAQIDNGQHELFNESEQIRNIVFQRIHNYLEE